MRFPFDSPFDMTLQEYADGAAVALEEMVLPEGLKSIGQITDTRLTELIITDGESFMRGEKLKLFLAYDGYGEKEKEWSVYVGEIYRNGEWEYVDGVPTPIKSKK